MSASDVRWTWKFSLSLCFLHLFLCYLSRSILPSHFIAGTPLASSCFVSRHKLWTVCLRSIFSSIPHTLLATAASPKKRRRSELKNVKNHSTVCAPHSFSLSLSFAFTWEKSFEEKLLNKRRIFWQWENLILVKFLFTLTVRSLHWVKGSERDELFTSVAIVHPFH